MTLEREIIEKQDQIIRAQDDMIELCKTVIKNLEETVRLKDRIIATHEEMISLMKSMVAPPLEGGVK